ncbi:heterogeneous nuclear ribonucleoprotein A3 homolog 2-like [Argopecten irradians]|uniref:heterogeneous nuclear ribonucleoprotein A3 homolog 2-like n=1 Tax=Argopecten irradians TaxID=31199 RepID=UPI0037156EAE
MYDMGGQESDDKLKKLFIGGLSFETTDDSLRTHFEQFGAVSDCVVIKDRETKRPKGFGFITYELEEGADNAQENRPHKLDGRQVETKRAMPRESGESSLSVVKMFVGGMNEDTTEEEVRDTFQGFGKITSVDLIKDKNTGKNKKFCFVSFEDYDSVDKCVLRKKFKIGMKEVEVKKALPKDAGEGGRGGGRGGMGGRGGRGGGRGGGGGGFNQGGYNQSGGYGQGGYDNYNQGGGSGYGYTQQYNSGGGGGGYDNYGGGYNQQGFGQGYGDNYGGGAMNRSGGGGGGHRATPYGNTGGSYNRGGGGGGYNRR